MSASDDLLQGYTGYTGCKVGWTGERCDCAKCETYRANLAAIRTPKQEWFAHFKALANELHEAAFYEGEQITRPNPSVSYAERTLAALAALLAHARRRID